MRNRWFYLIVILFSLMCLDGCLNQGKVQENTIPVQDIYIPPWWQSQPNAEYVYTYGTSIHSSTNKSKDAAYTLAIRKAPFYLEPILQNTVISCLEEASIRDTRLLASSEKIIHIVANSLFTNIHVAKSETIITDNNRYKTFLQVSIPMAMVEKKLVDSIRSEQSLYMELQRSKTFQAMERSSESLDK